MGKYDSLLAEADEERKVAKMSPTQRAAYSFMTGGANKKAYLEQTFGPKNVQPQGDEFQIRAGERAAWQPTNPSGLDLGDLTGLAGGAVEYAPAVVGAFTPNPVAGAVAGQVAGRSARELAANAILDNGTQKSTGELYGDVAMSAGEAALAGAAGRAIGAGALAIRPGARAAKEILKYPARELPPPLPSANPLFQTGAREVIDPANPAVRQAYETLATPSPSLATRALGAAKQTPDMLDLAMTAAGHPEAIVVRRGASVGLEAAKDALAKRDAKAIAKIMQEPGGLDMLKKLAAGGRNPATSVIVGEEALGLGLGGR